MLSIQVLQILRNVMEHAPVLLHLCQVLYIVRKVLFRLRFQLRVLREHTVDMHGGRKERRVSSEWRNNIMVHSLVDENGNLVRGVQC